MGDNDKTWPYQHLVHIFMQLSTGKHLHLCVGLSEIFKALCKKPDNGTRLDGIHLHLILNTPMINNKNITTLSVYAKSMYLFSEQKIHLKIL
jgi:hypothetical protein